MFEFIFILPLLQSFILLSFVTFLPGVVVYQRIKYLSTGVGALSVGVLCGVLVMGWMGYFPHSITLFQTKFILTKLSLVFWGVKTLLIFMAEIFSLRYLFHERGMFKFYFVVSLFSFSLNLIFFSDAFTSFTLGWELMGLVSVILIAFFENRRIAVERSFLTFLFYKLGDFFLLVALLYLSNRAGIHAFSDFKSAPQISGHSLILCLFILAAFVKSGVYPFSFWLPRSMEGPTPSSALFYGALSSHVGIFFLLQLSSVWGGFWGAPFILMLSLGGVSTVFASWMAQTRSDVKSQLIYATLCQISLIYIEIALGWHTLAVFHAVLHMSFRFFQFLMAPSAIYLAHKKDFFGVQAVDDHKPVSGMLYWVWWFSFHEFGLKVFWRQIILEPFLRMGILFRRISRFFHFQILHRKKKDMFRFLFFLSIFSFPIITQSYATISFLGVILCQALALIFSLISLPEKKLSTLFFNLIFSGSFLVLSFYYSTNPVHVHTFYVHLIASAFGFLLLGGFFIFFRNAFDLPEGHDFFGLNKISPVLSSIFALLILFILGFPGFSTYFSFELLSEDLSRLSAFAPISGLAILNVNAYLWFSIYARLFWGEGRTAAHLHISDV